MGSSSGATSSLVVEAMRASSPTRSPAVDEYAAWTSKHPSALASFDQIAAAAKGKEVVVFLDYDGTLSPIVQDPETAFITGEMREAVSAVAKQFKTAIVTGRSVEKTRRFVGLEELYYAGSHGMDIKGIKGAPAGSKAEEFMHQPALEFLSVIAEAYKDLVHKTSTTPRARVEDNKFCLSVHYRCVDEERWAPLREQVENVIREYDGLEITPGRKVLEVRPCIKWNKGNAVEFLLRSLGLDGRSDVLPLYVGDDKTDEDAFKVLRERGQVLGILVTKSPRDTDASYSLQDPTEVLYFLGRLVHWALAD